MSSRISAFSYLSFFTIFTLLLLVPSTSYAGPQAPCTRQCIGKSCGNDGCAGSCGTCPAGKACNPSGQCASSCTPQCIGKSCGNDGCGGSCGTCPAGKACSAAGQCASPTTNLPNQSDNSKPPKVTVGSDGSVPSLIRLKDTEIGKSIIKDYEEVLEGLPSDKELQDAVEQHLRSETHDNLRGRLRASDEYYKLSVEKLYQELLGRKKDESSWHKLLTAKPRPTLTAVEKSLISSKEYIERWLGEQFRTKLGRCPTEAAYQRFVDALLSKQVSFGTVENGIQNSSERVKGSNSRPKLETRCQRFRGTSIEVVLGGLRDAKILAEILEFVGPSDYLDNRLGMPEKELKEAENALKEAPVRVALLRFFSDSYPVDEKYTGRETEPLTLKLAPQNNSGRERYSTGPESESEKELWRLMMSFDLNQHHESLFQRRSQHLVVSAIKNYFNEYVVQKDGQPKPSSYRFVDPRQIYETKPNFPNPDKRVAYIEDKNGRKKFFGYYVAYQKQFGVAPNATPFESRHHRYWTEKPISEDQYIKYFQVHRQLMGLGNKPPAQPTPTDAERQLILKPYEGTEAERWKLRYADEDAEEEEEIKKLDAAINGIAQCLEDFLEDFTGFTMDELNYKYNEVESLPASEVYLVEQQEAAKKMVSEIQDEVLARFNRGKLKTPFRPFQFFRERKAKLTSDTLYNCMYPHLSYMVTFVDLLLTIMAEREGIPKDDVISYFKIQLALGDLPAPAYRRGLFQNRAYKK